MIGLTVIGNPPRSESEAWRLVEDRASYALFALDEMLHAPGTRAQRDAREKQARAWLHEIMSVAQELRLQARRGIHANPGRSRRNPPREAVMSENVQAIVYTHRDDGEFYIHTFGGRDPSDNDLALLSRMKCFTKGTRVRMLAESDGSVAVEGMDGQNLWKEF